MHVHLSCDMTKPTKWGCAQQRLGSAWASAQSDPSSLSAWRKLGSLATHWVHSEDWSDWPDVQADPSLRWAHTRFVGFVVRRLICRTNLQLNSSFDWKSTCRRWNYNVNFPSWCHKCIAVAIWMVSLAIDLIQKRICFTVTFTELRFSHKLFSEWAEVSLLNIC